MHDELKKRNWGAYAIAAGIILVLASTFGLFSRGTGPQSPAPGTDNKIELMVSRQMVQTMVDAALAENPSLRENLETLRKQYEDGAMAQEMLVAEAIENGIAARDPVVRNRLAELFILGVYQQADSGVTPEAIRKYYEENKGKYTAPERRYIQHLFVRVTNVTDSEKARATLEKLFRQALLPDAHQPSAVKEAIVPVWITREEITKQFGPTFSIKLFSLKAGEWSEPIESTSGWHRIRVLEQEAGRLRSFDEARAEVENDLRTKLRLEAYHNELQRLSNKYKVIVVE